MNMKSRPKPATQNAFPKSMTRSEKYPVRLWNMVNSVSSSAPSVMCWSCDGRSVVVGDRDTLVKSIVPQFNFNPRNWDSFKRNLCKYFFNVSRFAADGSCSFSHPLFTAFAVPSSEVNTRNEVAMSEAIALPVPQALNITPKRVRRGPPPPLPEIMTYAEAMAAFEVDTDSDSG